MQWSIPIHNLEHSTSLYENFGHGEKINQNVRHHTLRNMRNICGFCGGQYKKYLICSEFRNDTFDGLVMNCKMCYIIRHLNYGFFEEILLFRSKLTQIQIIQKTVDYIIKYNQIPNPIEIDSHIEPSIMSVIEYTILCNKKVKLDYKIFFSNQLDTNFITKNFVPEFQFLDENIEEENSIEVNVQDAEISKIGKIDPAELKLIKKYYKDIKISA
jgi:hypothetical protein